MYTPVGSNSSYCKTCVPDARASSIMYKYRVSAPQYEAMLSRHGGLCWICQDRKATCVDHDHACCPTEKTCGRCVRGMLCPRCNTALNELEAAEGWLKKASAYLRGGDEICVQSEAQRLRE
ncbi:endonuclease domain-containing protein [Streptomyces halstedii]|uniref:endonuclease domain-containing protein n=1 Tax=Streptomyces halstedii TaxID=1944 RepID=UPI00381BC80B